MLSSGAMKIFVGTSGWMYMWNPDGFDWYLKNSGLNAVELNASFYRFPYQNQVIGWARKTSTNEIRWAVKIHRSVSHTRMLKGRAKELWGRFKELFTPLDPYIDFYLLQLPPRYRPSVELRERLEDFVSFADLGWRLAVEFRHREWFNEEFLEWSRSLGFTFVSVDSPEVLYYARSGPYTYLRLHGRTFWYSHYYEDMELMEIANELKNIGGEATYVFFNNDHAMLENARRMFSILSDEE